MTKLRPLGDHIVIKKAEPVQETEHGIIIPEVARDELHRGEVIAVGTGKYEAYGDRQLIEVEVGELVIYGKYAGSEIEVDGEKLIVIRESDILVAVEQSEAPV